MPCITNAARHYRTARVLLRLLAAGLTWLFAVIQWQIFAMTTASSAVSTSWMIALIFVIIVFVPIGAVALIVIWSRRA